MVPVTTNQKYRWDLNDPIFMIPSGLADSMICTIAILQPAEFDQSPGNFLGLPSGWFRAISEKWPLIKLFYLFSPMKSY